MADIKDWKALSEPDTEWVALIDSIGGQAPDIGMFPDITSLRYWITESKKNMTATFDPVPGVKEEKDCEITVRDGSKITVRTYASEKSGGPLYVMYHGGGYCIGGLENEELLCRLICGKLGCGVVNVDYRLAPEHKFPAAVHDGYDATRWAAENASSFGADPSRGFIVGGTSAGGNIASNTVHIAHEEKLSPPITGCHLMIPSLCRDSDLLEKYRVDAHSWEQNKDAPILSRKACELFDGSYNPNPVSGDETASPLIWKGGHENSPPTYFQVCGMDPLRDEALILEKILREEKGVKTKVDVYPGLPHGYWGVFPQMKASQKFVEESVKGVQWVIEQKA